MAPLPQECQIRLSSPCPSEKKVAPPGVGRQALGGEDERGVENLGEGARGVHGFDDDDGRGDACRGGLVLDARAPANYRNGYLAGLRGARLAADELRETCSP